jgi:hypothetical protein
MTDEEEYAIRSKLKWQRDGTDWILLYGRRRMGRVVPDGQYPGMFRSVKSQGLSDMANLSGQGRRSRRSRQGRSLGCCN